MDLLYTGLLSLSELSIDDIVDFASLYITFFLPYAHCTASFSS